MNRILDQIVSKKRVADHGEVFTNPREVNAMLDLCKKTGEKERRKNEKTYTHQ